MNVVSTMFITLWHRVWYGWHFAKKYYYGSERHSKKTDYHQRKLAEIEMTHEDSLEKLDHFKEKVISFFHRFRRNSDRSPLTESRRGRW